MNQERLAAVVVAHLQRAAAAGELAWVPAVGITRPDGSVYGLGVEIFGAQPTRGQLDVLARVLFRLGTGGAIDVQEFKPNRKTGTLGAPHGTAHAVYSLAGGGSQRLRQDAPHEYGVRLTRA